jgi:hypothetical protein
MGHLIDIGSEVFKILDPENVPKIFVASTEFDSVLENIMTSPFPISVMCYKMDETGLVRTCRANNINSQIQLVGTKEVHIIDLGDCDKVTDTDLVYLKNVHVVDLSGCHRITDSGLMNLADSRVIYLHGCHKITNAASVLLKNVCTYGSVAL